MFWSCYEQCCKSWSGMFIPDPGSWFLPIPDLGSQILDPKTGTKERGEKKIFVIPFFVASNFTKIVNYFIFEMLKKKIWANFQRIIVTIFWVKSSKLSNIWVWDPGSGKNLLRIPDPRVKKAPDPWSGSATTLLEHVDVYHYQALYLHEIYLRIWLLYASLILCRTFYWFRDFLPTGISPPFPSPWEIV